MSDFNFAKYGPILLFFVGSLAAISEINYIDRTIDSMRLFGFAAGTGVFATVLMSKKLVHFAFKDEPWGARASYVLTLGIGMVAMSVYFSSILNRAFAPTISVSKTFDVVSKGYSGKGNTPYIDVTISKRVERFDVTPIVWSSVTNQVCFDVSPGNFGFDRIIRIRSC